MSPPPDAPSPGANTAKLSVDGSQAIPSFNRQVGGVASAISASASSFLTSFKNPSPFSVTASLASFSTNSSTAKYSHAQSSSSSSSIYPSTRFDPLPTNPSSTSSPPSSTNDTQGFRSQLPSRLYSSGDEFNLFSTLPPINDHSPYRDVVEDGLDVTTLLSQPLAPTIYSLDPELRRISVAHPTIHSFAICNDPVEFLSTTTEYTEEVWGEHLKVAQQAREEVLNDRKGKGKQDGGGTATARLRMIWRHLRVSGGPHLP